MADRNTSIRASQLRNGTVTDKDIQDDSLTGTKFVDVTISGGKIADGAISESKLDIVNNPIDGYYLKYTTASGMGWFAGGGGVSDHGALTGLADDDHTQYLLASGTRQLTGNWNIGNYYIGINTIPSSPLHIVQAPGDANLYQIQSASSPTGTHTATRHIKGFYNSINSSADADTYNSDIMGFHSYINSTGHIPNIYGSYYTIVNQSSSDLVGVTGVLYGITINAGNVTQIYGTNIDIGATTTGTLDSVIASRGIIRMSGSTGTLTEAMSFKAEITQSAATLSTGYLYHGIYSGTIGTKWGIYLSGEDKNYFSGNVLINTTSNVSELAVNGNFAVLNTAETRELITGWGTDYLSFWWYNGSGWDIPFYIAATKANIQSTLQFSTGWIGAPGIVCNYLDLYYGAEINEFSIDGTLAGNSDNAVPTEKAVKTYVDATASGGGVSDHGALTGLSDDDHTQYLLASGTRQLTGDWNIGNQKLGINVNPSWPIHLQHSPGDGNFKQIRGYANPAGSLTAAYDHYGAHNVIISSINKGSYQYNLYGGYFSAGMTGGYATTVNGAVGAFSCSSSSSISIGRGLYAICSVNSSGTSSVYGVDSSTIFSFSSDATNSVGLRSYTSLNTSGTVETAYGVSATIHQSNGTLTTGYLYHGIYSGTIGTKWGIYLSGEDKSYFSGKVGIGVSSPSQQLELSESLELPSATTSILGVIYKGADRFIHDFHHPTGSGVVPIGLNTFVGVNAGNFTMGSTAASTAHGSSNTGVGHSVLIANTTGYQNAAFGLQALVTNTTGYRNSAVGVNALNANTSGYHNSAVGWNVLLNVTEGHDNTAIGYNTGLGITIGDYNTIIGANVTGLASDLSNTVIIADGQGNQRIYIDSSGNILPNASGTQDIGSASLPWKDLYMTGNSLYMDGTKVISMSGGSLKIPSGDLEIDGNLMLSGNMAVYIKNDTESAGYSSIYLQGAGTTQGSVVAIGTGATSRGVIFACYGGMYTASHLQMYHDNTQGHITTGSGNIKLSPAGDGVQIANNKYLFTDEVRARDVSGLNLKDKDGTLGIFIEDGGKVSLSTGTGVNKFSTDTTLSGNSDDIVPTEKAVKTYVDSVTGSSSGCRVYRSTAQSIPAATWTKVQFNAEDYDNQSEYDNTTNYRFTAKVAGVYQVSASVIYAGITANSRTITNIYKGGSNHASGNDSSSSSTSQGQMVSASVKLAVGEYVEIWTYTSVAGNTYTNANCYMTVQKMTAASEHGSAHENSSYVKVSDVKATTTAGGTFTQDAWRTRVLNTEDNDPDGICSLSSNQITLDAGTYECRIVAPAFEVSQHQARLYNTTAAATILIGDSAYSASTAGYATTICQIAGRFTIAASQALEVQHYCTTTQADNGFGVNADTGLSEVYTVAEFWKISEDGSGSGSGFSSRVSVSLSANQTGVVHATWTKVELNTEQFDGLGEFNTSTHLFTPNTNGYYQINACIGHEGMGDADTVQTAIYKNSARVAHASIDTGGSSSPGIPISKLVYLTTSDTVSLWGRHTLGSNGAFDAGVAETYLTIHRVS